MQSNQLPLVPEHILKAHKVNEPTDSRFMAVARLLQSLWREDKGLLIGFHCHSKGKRRKLGSRLDAKSAKEGGNFLTPDIAKLAFRESVYREIGAMIDQERLWTNLLSSQTLCFNLFGGLKLNLDKATQFFRMLLPDFVTSVEGIIFEHSPGRGNPELTDDYTAFDVFVCCTTTDGASGFIAIEVKYSERMVGYLAAMRPRYDVLSKLVGVYNFPDSLTLRSHPIQQFWREHMLSRIMIESGQYSTGRFVVICPKQNILCVAAAKAYQRQLVSHDPQMSGFQVVTLDDCVETFRTIGDHETADALHGRYLDFERVEQAIFG